MIRLCIQFPVSQFLPYLLSYAAALNQPFNLSFCGFPCTMDKLPDNIITTRIYPIILWPCRRIHLKRMTVVYNIPGTVYIHLTKPIPVIPFPDRIILFHPAITGQHFPDFPVRKAKIFIILHILDRVYTEIIQPRKNALLWHPQTSR